MKDEDWIYIAKLVNAEEPIAKKLVTGERGEFESFEDFKLRRKLVHIAETLRAKGTMFIRPTNETYNVR